MYTMRQPVEYARSLFGERTATVFHGADGAAHRTRTYSEFADRVARVAAMLDGITEPGDRVALWALNSDRYLELFMGIPAAGRAIVPHNTRWAEAEIAFATEDAGARVLICDRDPGQVADLVDVVIRLDTDDYEQRLTDAESGSAAPVDITPETLAGLFYTGGTTGRPKGVMLTHQNLMANAIQAQVAQPLMTDDRYLTIAPMFHAAGVYCAISVMLAGATNVIAESFAPGQALDIIESDAITCLIAVPTMLAAMNETQSASPRNVSSLSWISHGASPVTLEVLRRTDALFGCELIHLYGATELSPLASAMRHEESLLDHERARSAGQALPFVELRIDQPDGDGVGELLVRGANVMAGYWNQPEQTAEVLSDEGWYRTGDVGYLDDDGFLFLVDRAKDMIVSGGENVYCSEVEDAIYTHPAVLEATVFGIPDDRWGELVHAVVVRRDGTDVTDNELIAHCRDRIAGYKVPKSVEFSTEPLPKSGPGKVLKRDLRAPYWEGRDRAIN